MKPNAKTELAAYYSEVSERLQSPPNHQKVAYIVVSHVLPDAPVLIEAIAKIGRVAAVIPKTSHRDAATFQELKEKFNVPFPESYAPNDKPKDQLRDPARAVEFLKQYAKPSEKLIILDHGGYFANAYDAIHKDPILKDAVIGITEATENGHQKYQRAMTVKLDGIPSKWTVSGEKGGMIPVYSRARSKLKAAEDHNVGIAILHSTENILRNVDNVRVEDCKHIGVFGFGKIGRSIANKLQREGLAVTICEKDPAIAAQAVAMGFKVADKATLLRESDLLFCATGNKIIRGNDWNELKNGVYIVSATSADDEFDKSPLASAVRKEEDNGNNVAYTFENGKTVNLLKDGESVNFVDKSVLGPSVLLPEAETLVTADYLRSCMPMNTKPRLVGGKPTMQPAQLPVEYKNAIAAIWMKHFGGLDMTKDIELPRPPDQSCRRSK